MTRSGPFNFDEIIDRTCVPALKHHRVVLGNGGQDLFAAGVADMDFRAPPVVLAAMLQPLAHGVFGYETLDEGLVPALTGWLARRHNWQVEAGHINRAPNVLNALAMALDAFTSPGDGVIVQPPVFFDFFDVLKENNRTAALNPLVLQDGRYTMDYAGLEAIAADARTTMMFLCNPHNPVGRVWTRDELQHLSDICARHNVLVVSDEIHGDLAYPATPYTPFAALGPEAAANCIACISPAKSFNIAACSSAFTIIADDDRRKTIQAQNSRLTVNKNNAFANAAMQAAYNGADDWLDAVLDYIAGNVADVRQCLARLPGVTMIEPEGTFLLWLDFRGLDLDPDALTWFLRHKARWAITRGRAFGPEGTGFARLNIACPRARLSTALDQLASAVAGL